ncbi:MAG TPA: trehalose-6-phosphate synthase [Acidimicrobiia bacterium]|nr:trehalose-6-phosphate synthase [Acidimicrobiia bacterium]
MIVVSHRGPIAFTSRPGGGFTTARGGGGLVSALTPLIEGRDDVRWIAAAISAGDRAAIAAGAADVEGFNLDLVAPDPTQHRLHYDVISNATLWFLFHDLFDLPRRPRLDQHFRTAWDAYRAVNEVFADAVCEQAPRDDVVLIQDLHFLLLPGMVRQRRPDLRLAHFMHTPFCGADSIRILPDDVTIELLTSMAAAPAGFHTERWAAAYRSCVDEVLGRPPPAGTFVTTFGPDLVSLTKVARSAPAEAAGEQLASRIGDRALIFRTDRIELSKNIPRGFLAFERLLEVRPEWRERVVFAAFVYPSREGLPEYLAYRQEVEHTARRVNERWATSSWQPILLDTRDDFPRSVAGLERADVLFVNPLRDGLNLVAKEGPLLSRRDVVVCLSRGAGAFDELREGVVEVHAFDLEQNATALHNALTMAPAERARRGRILRTAAGANPATAWLDEQVACAT